jgi:5-(carboxyamino)imidazole ribonucleotide synthase
VSPIYPGKTLGILGSGQLGRMFALEARRMGYRVHTFSPEKDSPTGQVADLEFIGNYEDVDRAREFAKGVDVVTFEFENISSEVVKALEAIVPTRPNARSLHIAQNRLREKTFLHYHKFPVTPFAKVDSEKSVLQAVSDLGLPLVLKTSGFGYDGKGQTIVYTSEEATSAFAKMDVEEAIVEKFIEFDVEISVVAARGIDGEFAAYPPVQNIHLHHILDVTIAPADISDILVQTAKETTRAVMEELDYVGTLCIEFFVTKDSKLLINEIAPRPHNSGHWTIDGCVTNQFEQQVRAICGFPLGSTDQLKPAAMVNLLGDIWADGEPNWNNVLKDPDAKIHLYGKKDARPGRKMGHITVTATTSEEVQQKVLRLKQILGIEV